MAIDEPVRDDDEFLSSLTRYHELLSAIPSGARPGDLPALPGSASSSRLQRAQDCLRLLHSTWSDERPESLPSQPREVPESLASQEPRGPNGQRVRVGRFEIVRELGRGAFGIVFLASDPVLGREVALKLPRPEAVLTPGFRRRFVREAQAAAAVDHPNLVSVYEAGEWGPACYIATEYCAGQTLAAWLFHRAEPVPPAMATTLVAGLARALDYVHNHGIIHRDLKPSNVILVPKAGSEALAPCPDNQLEFVPKITDFGLAKLLERDPHETCSTGLFGTPAYMAPEQAEPRLGEVGRHTDVYALGVILYEMLAGQAPFIGTSDVETLKRVALDEPVPPRRLRRGLRRDLEAICLKCLEKQPSARYQSAAALADDLEQFLAGRPTKARPLGPLGRSLKAARRHTAVTALLATLVVLAVAGLAGHWSQAAHMRDVLGVHATMYNALVQDQATWIYARDLSSAAAAWTTGQLADADDLLAGHRRKSGEKDSREFVWHYLWRLCHAERLTIGGRGTPVFTVSCSHDGKLLASAGSDGAAHLWDVATGRELATFRGHVGDVNMVCFSSDGRLLATAGDDRTVRLWNVAPPGPRAIIRGHTASVYSAAFSPDGKTVASAGGEEVVRLWDTATSRERLALHGHNGHVKRLAFSPDGGLLATAARDGTCQVWDLKTGRARKGWTAHPGASVECLNFSHEGRTLVTGGEDRKIRIWDAATSALKSTLSGHLEAVLAVSFAPDDRTLAAAIKDGTVWRWDLAGAKPLGTVVGQTKRVWHGKFALDGRTLATASVDGTVKLWDANAGQMHATISGLDAPPAGLAFTRDGYVIAGLIPGPAGGRFRAWDVRTGKELGSYLDLDGHLGTITASVDRALAVQAAIGENGLGIRVMMAKSWRWDSRPFVLSPLPSQRPVTITCMAISSDARFLATGHPHGKVVIWESETGRPRETMSPEKAHDVCAVRFSPDGSLVAAGSQDGTVRLWDVASGALRTTLSGHLGAVRSLAFSPDGSALATASDDRTVRVWSVATGFEQGTLRGHAGEVQSVAFSPGGKTLASGGAEGTLKLWHAATWQQLISLNAHRGGVSFLAFSPDGMVLASGGATIEGRGEIFLWRADTGAH
jgi:WD40 repeat protein